MVKRKYQKRKIERATVRTFNLGNPHQHVTGHLGTYVDDDACRHAFAKRSDVLKDLWKRGMVDDNQYLAGEELLDRYAFSVNGQHLRAVSGIGKLVGKGRYNPAENDKAEKMEDNRKIVDQALGLLDYDQKKTVHAVCLENKYLSDLVEYTKFQTCRHGKAGRALRSGLDILVVFFKLR